MEGKKGSGCRLSEEVRMRLIKMFRRGRTTNGKRTIARKKLIEEGRFNFWFRLRGRVKMEGMWGVERRGDEKMGKGKEFTKDKGKE
jgi:hypothetical protein